MKTYISTDVEYSWESNFSRWQGSLLSLWSCVVWDINTTFYSEIQPINRIYNEQAMQVIAPWFVHIWDTQWLSGEKILTLLEEKGVAPEELIRRYSSWLEKRWDNIAEAATPIKFDGGLTSYYFRKYADKNPLWFSWLDGKSMLQWFLSDPNINFKKLLWWEELPHNALKDSQIQAIEMEFLFRMMQDARQWADYQERYAQSFDKFYLSPEVKNLITWSKDTISDIRNTKFWNRIRSYNTLLWSEW